MEPWDAALYLRQSKGKAAIPRQRRYTTAHIEARGGRVVIEFADRDATAFQRPGEEPPDREGFNALIAYVTANPGVRPAAWHVDRLIRSSADANRLIGVCHRDDHLIETKMSGAYDLSNANGRKHLQADALAASHEVDHAIERILARKLEAATEGLWGGGPRPFGWEPVPSAPGDDRKFAGLRIRESEASLVRDAAAAILSGTSLSAVSRQWNSRDIPGTLGGRWDSQKVRRVLLRPRNAGICVHLGAEASTGEWPAILDEDVFRAVQATLLDPSRNVSPGPERRWLGSGFYLCGICGATLHAHHAGGGRTGRSPRTVYRCKGHVGRSALPLDEWIGDLVAARLATADQRTVPRETAVPDSASLHAQILVQRAAKGEAADLFQQRAIDGPQLARITAAADREITALQARLAEAVKASPLTGMPVGAEAIREWFRERHVSRQRAIAAGLFEWIRVMSPARRGKPAGVGRGEAYFDVSAIHYEWR